MMLIRIIITPLQALSLLLLLLASLIAAVSTTIVVVLSLVARSINRKTASMVMKAAKKA